MVRINVHESAAFVVDVMRKTQGYPIFINSLSIIWLFTEEEELLTLTFLFIQIENDILFKKVYYFFL